jgi:hypothetical protein
MRGRDALGVLGVGGFAVVCCAGLPAVLAFAGGVTVVGYLGGGLLAAVVVGFAAMVLVRARRRRDCAGGSPRGDVDR